MNVNRFLATAVVAASSLLLHTTEVQAQGRRQYTQAVGNYGWPTQYYSYPSSRVVTHSSNRYGTRTYYPSSGYSTGYNGYNFYGYPNQSRYLSPSGYRGNSYRSGYGGYGYQSGSGLSIGIGVGSFGNRSYSGFGTRGYPMMRNSIQTDFMRGRFGGSNR